MKTLSVHFYFAYRIWGRQEGVGETRFTTGNMQTDKLFTGQREITGLGIYHFGARFYSPKLGRFLSADTIVPGAFNPQALNRFSYTLNNPVRYTDPSGHGVDCGIGTNCVTQPGTAGVAPNSSTYICYICSQPKKTNNTNNNEGSTPTFTPTTTPTPDPTVTSTVTSTATSTATVTATSTPAAPFTSTTTPTATSTGTAPSSFTQNSSEQSCGGCHPEGIITGTLALFEGLAFTSVSIAAYAFVIGGTGPIGIVLGAPFVFTTLVGLDWALYGAQEILYSGSDKEADPILLIHLVFPDLKIKE